MYCFLFILRNEKVDYILSSAPLCPPHMQFALLVLRMSFQLIFTLLSAVIPRSFSARPLFIQLIFFLFLFHSHSPCFHDPYDNITSPKICLLHNLTHTFLPLALCFLLFPPSYHISSSQKKKIMNRIIVIIKYITIVLDSNSNYSDQFSVYTLPLVFCQ